MEFILWTFTTQKKKIQKQIFTYSFVFLSFFVYLYDLAFLPSMIQRRQGKIVCVSSVVGKISIPYRSAYTASKHALEAFCDCLRAEMAAFNIQVLVASPGYVATDVSRNALTGYGTAHGGNFMYLVI